MDMTIEEVAFAEKLCDHVKCQYPDAYPKIVNGINKSACMVPLADTRVLAFSVFEFCVERYITFGG